MDRVKPGKVVGEAAALGCGKDSDVVGPAEFEVRRARGRGSGEFIYVAEPYGLMQVADG